MDDKFNMWKYEEPTYFACEFIVTEVQLVVLPAKDIEDFLAKAKEKGYDVLAPFSKPRETKNRMIQTLG